MHGVDWQGLTEKTFGFAMVFLSMIRREAENWAFADDPRWTRLDAIKEGMDRLEDFCQTL